MARGGRGGRGGGRRGGGGMRGRGGPGRGGSRGGSGGRRDGSMGFRKEDFEDEVDVFAKGRNKVSLNDEEGSEPSGSEDEDEAVMDLKGSESEDDSEDEDDDEDDDEELGGMTAKLAKQAKFMKQKLAAMGVGNEDEDDEDEDEEDKKLWGKSKKVYYGGDNVDLELTDDEEAPAEEEEIALEQQRKLAQSLRPEDYEQELDDESEDEASDGGEETLEEAAKRVEKGGVKNGVSRQENGVTVEEVKKDLNSLTQEEKLAAVMSEAPELVSLLGELREGLREITEKVQPILKAVKDGKYATQDGISYLEAKHLLLLTYCQNIVFYLLLKAEGRPVRDHPVITRMVELRLFLEKIRPIDKKLQYQIDKLLAAAKEPAANGTATPGDAGAPADALKYRPNPDAMVSKVDEEGADGLYRPPMMTPAAMEEDPDKRNRKEERSKKESARRASRSALIRTLAEEIEGRPEEVREDAVLAESQRLLRERARLQARAEAEENLFTRVPLTKAEKARQKSVKRSTGMADMLDDFDDDVADLVAEGEREEGGRDGAPPEDLLKRRKLSQAVVEEARPEKRARVLSGDADLPVRENLGERRKKHDVRVPRGGISSDSEPDEAGPSGEFEDEFYKLAKEQSRLKKAAKAAKYDRTATQFGAEEALAEGKRGINKQIEKNKGLTPHRKKAIKNPRVKQRMRHAKAVINRKGQVREAKVHTSGYGGEASGIKSSISRSVRMQS